MSYQQERLWFLDQFDKNAGTAYHVEPIFHLKGNLDLRALEKALLKLVVRHESLRTVFIAGEDGVPHQKIISPTTANFSLEIQEDFSGNKEGIKARISGLLARPIDLETGPVFRATVIKLFDGSHLLIIGGHHIILDGWSLDVLYSELEALYEEELGGQKANILDLPMHYADYAVWQRRTYSGKEIKQDIEWWKEELQGLPSTINLPVDRQRPSAMNYQGGAVPISIPTEIIEEAKKLSQRADATLFMVIETVFAVLLSRLGAGDDFVLGTAVAGRSQTDLERLCGFFVNTVALRQRINLDRTVFQQLQLNREITLDAFSHSEIPFEAIVDAIAPDRSMGHAPIIQVLCVLQNTPEGEGDIRLRDLSACAYRETPVEKIKFELCLELTETVEGLIGELTYSSQLFNASTAQHIGSMFENFFAAMVSSTQTELWELPLLGEEEIELVTSTFNIAKMDQAPAANITSLLVKQAHMRPDSIALLEGEKSLTYAQLDEDSDHLAQYLLGLAVGPEMVVGVCLQRSVDLITTLFALFKIGGGYMPLDPDYPAERLNFMVSDVAAKVIVTASPFIEKLRPAIKGLNTTFICLDAPEVSFKISSNYAFVPAHQKPIVSPDNLAYVIYTSGSTGRPKGVAVNHQCAVQLAKFQGEDFLGGKALRVGWFASIGFDASISEVLMTFWCGGSLITIPNEVRNSGRDVIEFIDSHRIEAITLPPLFLKDIVKAKPSGLECLVNAGDIAPPDASKQAAELFDYINAYGPTENTVCATRFRVPQDFVGGSVPIGSPISGTEAYVVDEHLQLLPLGVLGELVVGGLQVSRGYVGRSGLTAERFIADPFSGRAGARLYKTGDLVRWLDNGDLQYVGRSDFHVKIRGYRIELGEIEQALTSQPQVKQALVVVHTRTGSEQYQYLVAYYVPSDPACDGADFDDTLRKVLSSTLPEYMVPSVFIKLMALPLTVSGKLDRKALPDPETALSKEAYVAPKNDLERQLCNIWMQVLGLKRISVNTGFFKIGGNSIQAIRLVTRINQELGHQLTVAAIFEHRTIAALAEALGHTSRAQLVIPKAAEKAQYPLSFAQERLWFIDQYEGGISAYHSPRLFRLSETVNCTALKVSLAAIVARHEALHSHFIKDADGTYYQKVCQAPFLVNEHFLEETEWEDALKGAIYQTFDLEREPPIRATIYTVGEQAYLLVVLHHVAFDGWSSQVLLNDLALFYHHYVHGAPLKLLKLTIQYKDFAVWQRGYLSGERLHTQLTYWKERLAGYETLAFPTDFPRPAQFDYKGDAVTFALDAGLSTKLRALAKARRVSLDTLLRSAYAVLLSRTSGQSDIVFGAATANRHYPQVENLIGFFVNTLALRVQVAGRQSFSDLLQTVHLYLSEAQHYQDIPFELLVSALEVERDRSRHPIFQHSFSLQSFPGKQIEGVEPVSLYDTFKRALFDLSLFMDASLEAITGRIEYATSLFTQARIKRFTEHFKILLTGIVAAPELPVSDYTLLPSREYDLVVRDWNQTHAQYPKDKTLTDLFEAQVLRTPERIAVAFEDEALTYLELNARANQLAHAICRDYQAHAGEPLRPDTLIALFLERGLGNVVSILAVLKAGGAYLPIDPDYPKARACFMLTDSRVPLLLTQLCHAPKLRVWIEEMSKPPRIIAIDDKHALEECCCANLGLISGPQNLAYVIYTSGTTGKPKGVMVAQQSVINLAQNETSTLGLVGNDHVLQYASFGFDASVSELFAPLVTGSSLYICPKVLQAENIKFSEYLVNNKITLATVPPQLLKVLSHREIPELKTLVIAGEACELSVMKFWSKGRTLINAYGPTESTVCASRHPYKTGDSNTNIGKPLANITCYVLDPYLEPVAVGAFGELYIGGVGLARGYLNRPGLTSVRFIANPFACEDDLTNGHTRLYKTGDLVRWLDNGDLQYVGRTDFQVKIRGYRIELSGVEQALTSQAQVKQAVVVAQTRPGAEQSQYLAAYYVPSQEAQQTLLSTHTKDAVEAWKGLYQSAYERDTAEDKTFDIAGWESSFTGQPILESGMREWVAATIERITALEPKHILEIGCGTGLLLYPLLDVCEHYTATDFSEAAISRLKKTVVALGKADKITGLVCDADAVGTLCRDTSVDTVVINSVVQYFPGLAYFEQVLEDAISCIQDHGTIFIGDVRDHRLLESFHFAVQAYLAPESRLGEAQKRARWLAYRDKELLLNPEYFIKLTTDHPAVSHVQILPKRGDANHEMNRFRYDVILKIDRAPAKSIPVLTLPRFSYSQSENLSSWLQDHMSGGGLIIDGYPNKRVWANCQALYQEGAAPSLTRVSEVLTTVDFKADGILDIEALHSFARDNHQSLEIFLDPRSGKADQFTLLFRPLKETEVQEIFTDHLFEHITTSDQLFSNIPYTAQRAELTQTLRAALSSTFPDYMVPSIFVELNAIPLTVNGKLDRKALPAPEVVLSEEAYSAPRSDVERQLSSIWSQVLGLVRIGVNTNFFKVGGDSIQAIRLVTQINSQFRLQLTVATVFEYPTISKLAERLDVGVDEPLRSGLPLARKDINRIEGFPPPQKGTPETLKDDSTVLLTGATGFLGRYLLRDLLATTNTKVKCLVRGDTPEHARTRLLTALSSVEPKHLSAITLQRIEVINGDFSEPKLNLSDSLWNQLCEETDLILHNGAEVNTVKPYSSLRCPNVISLYNLLSLMTEGRPKKLHFISTMGVFAGIASGKVEETTSLSDHPPMNTGYALSKWVCEQILAQARERGFNVNWHRPGLIIGDSNTGYYDARNSGTAFIQLAKEVRAVPDLPAGIIWINVNRASSMILEAVFEDKEVQMPTHIFEYSAPTAETVVEAARRAGLNLQPVKWKWWYKRVQKQVRKTPNHPATWFVSQFLDPNRNVQKDTADTHEKLTIGPMGTVFIDGQISSRHGPKVDNDMVGQLVEPIRWRLMH
ncbi:non-ribosomal peptide synthetase [Flexibacterium corallicola]|uniref:non-ribosomal peptide synthetase n=1 Tax=Flexibacterium corallicola TaxID=3037259 RepID=UPI00286F2F58|nr:non-ribosomal peptide synthetase [Pseudovibrio sp. M1P-2-3]